MGSEGLKVPTGWGFRVSELQANYYYLVLGCGVQYFGSNALSDSNLKGRRQYICILVVVLAGTEKIMLHFMTCHSKMCHRRRASSLFK